MANIENKNDHKLKIMHSFITATEGIVQKEGVKSVTIRKVAEIAGYNSATIYNYFDDRNHLIYLSVMQYMDNFNHSIPNIRYSCDNSLQFYLKTAELFLDYSFKNSDIFKVILEVSKQGKAYKYSKQYSQLFPERKTFSTPTVQNAQISLVENNLIKQSQLLLDRCVSDGYINVHSAKEFNEIAVLIYYGMLKKIAAGEISAELAKQKCIGYLSKIFKSFVKPKHQYLLENSCV